MAPDCLGIVGADLLAVGFRNIVGNRKIGICAGSSQQRRVGLVGFVLDDDPHIINRRHFPIAGEVPQGGPDYRAGQFILDVGQALTRCV